MARCRRALLTAVTMLVIAWLVNDTSLEAALLKQGHQPLSYVIKVTAQLVLALLAARLVDLTTSSAASMVRWARNHRGVRQRVRIWQYSTPEGMIVGILVIGVCLGWAPKDVYRHPKESRRVELHRSSLLENPLGFPPGSRGTTKLVATYWSNEGRRVVRGSWEFTDGTAAERVTSRSILWSTGETERSILKLPNGECLFFPRSFVNDDALPCPRESVMEAFLSGESLDYVLLMVID